MHYLQDVRINEMRESGSELTTKARKPVVGRLSLAVLIVARLTPDVPVPIRIIAGRFRLLKPLMLYSCERCQ